MVALGTAAVLFGLTRQAILSLTFMRPDESFYLREIVRRTGRGVGAVQRELAQLTASGILLKEKQRYFRANPASPLYDPLKQIVIRTMGVADGLRGAISSIEADVAVAFIFGSFARGEQHAQSDVDVMIIAKDDRLTLQRVWPALRGEQERLGREINPFVVGIEEFRKKVRRKNPFMRRVLASPKIFLVGDGDELERMAEKRVDQGPPDKSGGDRRPARPGRSRFKGRKGQRAQ